MPNTSNPLSPEFFINPRCPLGAAPAANASINVRSGEVTNAPEREAPAAVLETDNNEVDEQPRLGRVMSLFSPLRVTRESEEHDVSGLYFVVLH